MARSPFQTCPPEIISIIVSMVDIEDYMFLKLSCKAVAACMPRGLVNLMENEREELMSDISDSRSMVSDSTGDSSSLAWMFLNVHRRMESRARSLLGDGNICLLCLSCGRVKPPKAFTDEQRAVAMNFPSEWVDRFCVACKLIFTGDQGFTGHNYFGVESYGCQACLQLRPVLDFLHERARDHDLLVAVGVDNGRICIDCVEQSVNDNTWDFDVVARNKQLRLRHEGFYYWLQFETELLQSMDFI